MYSLKVKSHFDAAHYIRDYQGKCSRLHGHRWEIEVVYKSDRLDRRNILIDFGVIKGILEELLDQYLDHYLLNDTLNEPNLTAEFLSKWLYTKLLAVALLSDVGLVGLNENVVSSVTVWESPECSVTYTEEEVK